MTILDFISDSSHSSSILFDASTFENIEVRPGRILSYQKIILSSKSNASSKEEHDDFDHDADDTSSSNTNANSTAYHHLLFIHGSCGASTQFYSLIHSLQDMLRNHQHSVNSSVQLVCHLFDAWGCGQSSALVPYKPNTKDFHASFSSQQLLLDLEAVLAHIRKQQEEHQDSRSSTLYIVAHSYGVSQILQVLHQKIDHLDQHNKSTEINNSRNIPIQGLILISAVLKDPSDPLTRDGGHFIFKWFPTFILRHIQSMLTQNFIHHAIHPQNIHILQEDAIRLSNANDMNMCKAFYTQQRYISSEQVMEVSCDYYADSSITSSRSSSTTGIGNESIQYPKFLLIHGKEDQIFPLSKVYLFHDAMVKGIEKRKKNRDIPMIHVVDFASHQVFQEKPNQVAAMIWEFMSS